MRAFRDLDSLPPEIDRPGSAPEFLLLHVHDIGGGMENIPIPDFGDVAGLTGLYWQAITNIRSPDMPEADKQAWIEMIDQEFRGPREVTGSESPKFRPGCHQPARGVDTGGDVDGTQGSFFAPDGIK